MLGSKKWYYIILFVSKISNTRVRMIEESRVDGECLERIKEKVS
jgi:hypothetical protein